ncbi:MAG: cation:proton antiporter [Vicinamibacterales bacterium]
MSELPLLVTITLALAYALLGGLIARRIGLPPIVGYLVAGVALGPFTPGIRGDEHAIGQLAEFGVILLMFGVGLHFSFRDFWQVRQVAVPGAVLQMAIVSAVGFGLGRLWHFSVGGAWLLGIAISVASTVVLMRALMDRGWLDTPHGKVAIGWLVFEDLITVGVLVLLPVVAVPSSGSPWTTAGVALGKAAAFVLLMMLVGTRVVPFLLGRVVHTRSRELFVLVALTMAAGTALVSAAVFNVSLALGAFVAGVVVSESPFSHQIGADLLPFREAFAVLFFVSVGMLVNPVYVASHWGQVLVLTSVIVIFKAFISGLLGAVLPGPAHTALVLAAGRSQIGEFSFILGQTGLALGLIDANQYSLILAGALISITLNAFMFKLIDPAERALKRSPRLWRWFNHGQLRFDGPVDRLTGHVVIVGSGRVGRHLSEALGRLQIPRLVVEADPTRAAKLRQIGVPVLFGDAASSEILDRAGLDRARVLAITVADDASALAVAGAARQLAPSLRVVSRAATWEAAKRLKKAGVGQVVRPEFEGGIEIVRRTLLDLDLPAREVQRYVDTVRHEALDTSEHRTPEQTRLLEELVSATRDLDLSWIEIAPAAAVVGRTIGESALRTKTGASVVAVLTPAGVRVNPGPDVELAAGYRLGIIGTDAQIASATKLLEG